MRPGVRRMDEHNTPIDAKPMAMVQIAIITDLPVSVIIGSAIIDAGVREGDLRRIAQGVVQMGVFHVRGDYSFQIVKTDARLPLIMPVVGKDRGIVESILQPPHPIEPGTIVAERFVPEIAFLQVGPGILRR
jgi:hypothetical protein